MPTLSRGEELLRRPSTKGSSWCPAASRPADAAAQPLRGLICSGRAQGPPGAPKGGGGTPPRRDRRSAMSSQRTAIDGLPLTARQDDAKSTTRCSTPCRTGAGQELRRLPRDARLEASRPTGRLGDRVRLPGRGSDGWCACLRIVPSANAKRNQRRDDHPTANCCRLRAPEGDGAGAAPASSDAGAMPSEAGRLPAGSAPAAEEPGPPPLGSSATPAPTGCRRSSPRTARSISPKVFESYGELERKMSTRQRPSAHRDHQRDARRRAGGLRADAERAAGRLRVHPGRERPAVPDRGRGGEGGRPHPGADDQAGPTPMSARMASLLPDHGPGGRQAGRERRGPSRGPPAN